MAHPFRLSELGLDNAHAHEAQLFVEALGPGMRHGGQYRARGQPGQRNSAKREVFLDRQDAVIALEKARDGQLKRGFQVMFAQGADDPRRL